jgi:SAM-dependent methyltransferase
MDRATANVVRSLPYRQLDVLEISGRRWEGFGFRTYRRVEYPDYDICGGPLIEAAFDLVIAEQVLEHVPRPLLAARHVWQMLRPGGAFLATTPFLLRIHLAPLDCTRWTATGLQFLLADAGFDPATLVSGSWGNRACVVGNFRSWRRWVRWLHSLRNEPEFPVVVWAMARKPSATP